MNKTYSRIIIALIFVGLIIALKWIGIEDYLHIDFFKEHNLRIQLFIYEHYFIAVLLSISILVAMVACMIPISPALNIVNGYFFGAIAGALYSVIGSTIGALISFFIMRYLLYGYIQKKYGHRLQTFNMEVEKRGVSYLLFMQLLPITPFAAIVIIASLSPLSWWTFAWTTAVGILPGSLIYTFAGRQLMYIKEPADIFSWPLIIALLLLACIALLPMLMQKRRERKA